MKMKVMILLGVTAALLVTVGCDQKPAPPGGGSADGGASAKASAPALPADLFLTAAPAGAKDVKDAKTDVKVGQTMTITGRIGGSTEPFVDGRAIFTIVDPHVKSCAEMEQKDHCKTPWDYCCEPRDELTANMATVRVAGADGQPLKIGLKDVQGLKPLAIVTVRGTVSQAEAGGLVLNAAGIFVAK